MNHIASFLALSLLCLVLLASCRTTSEQADSTPGTPVQVTNRNWLGMEIYVVGQSQRVRLGRVGAGKTKRFTIPGYLLSGATPLQFLMESSGTQRDIRSESFVVIPGEEVILVIPNSR